MDCIKRKHKLDEWESKFVHSLKGKEHSLTQMQLAKLEEIWDRVT